MLKKPVFLFISNFFLICNLNILLDFEQTKIGGKTWKSLKAAIQRQQVKLRRHFYKYIYTCVYVLESLDIDGI